MFRDHGQQADESESAGQEKHLLSEAERQHLYTAFAGQCAFSGCPYQVQLPEGVTILEIAHIFASNPGGPRFNPAIGAGQANEDSNLILLCPVHHRLVDENPSAYPAEVLRHIRDNHLTVVTTSSPSAPPETPHRLSGASRLEHALSIWERERQNGSEEFWQKLFSNQPELLAAATNGGAFTLNKKCYIGGKAIDNYGGNVVDFLLQQKGNVVLVEIKTPQAKLLGGQYRTSVYAPSHELAGSVAQVLAYRMSLQHEIHNLAYHSPGLSVVNPQAFLLIGDSEDETFSPDQERSFELFRTSLKDVVIYTYDQLFDGVRSLSAWMEPYSSDADGR